LASSFYADFLFEKITPATLYVDVLRAAHSTVFVKVHHPTLLAASFEFPAQTHKVHRPALYGWVPIADLENALRRRLFHVSDCRPLTRIFPLSKHITIHIAITMMFIDFLREIGLEFFHENLGESVTLRPPKANSGIREEMGPW
jgi:hypothetical protein